jgi:hypothetical protein
MLEKHYYISKHCWSSFISFDAAKTHFDANNFNGFKYLTETVATSSTIELISVT